MFEFELNAELWEVFEILSCCRFAAEYCGEFFDVADGEFDVAFGLEIFGGSAKCFLCAVYVEVECWGFDGGFQ